MHQKKRKLHKLHSIPIDLCNNIHRSKRLYLVSYGIPLSSLVVLLLTGIFAINPSLSLKTSAVTIQDEWVVGDSESESKESKDSKNSDNGVMEEDNTRNDIMPLDDWYESDTPPAMACDGTPALRLVLQNADQVIQSVQGGNTVYGGYDMALDGCQVKDYTLSIRADSVNLTPPNGASASTSTVGGAGGKTGDTMVANTWGYNFTDRDTAEGSYGGLNYANLPTAATTLASGNVTGDLALTKKLVFAAKFAEDAAPGTYTGHITLSAVATEITQLWSDGTDSGIRNMQDISAGFCKSSLPTGATITLRDNRDSNNYTVYKAADGNCWMGQNLSLTGPMTLTSSNSDVSSNWTLPASVTSWNTSDYNAVQVRTGSTSLTGWKQGFGNYYSWPAATAGTGTTSVVNADASSSICPRGWKLPAYSGNGSFQNLTATKSSWLANQTINGISGINGYYFGSTATNLNNSANFWPAAGRVNQTSGALADAGSYGYYWSRRALSNTNFAYNLYFKSSNVYPQNGNDRYVGFAVRCVAEPAL